jgi:hypothetical protein
MTDSPKKSPKEELPISEELMMKYLNHELSEKEQHELQQQIESSHFLSDAEEGLRLITEKKQVSEIAQQINRKMRKKLRKQSNKHELNRHRLFLIATATLLLLLLVALSFVTLIRLKNG